MNPLIEELRPRIAGKQDYFTKREYLSRALDEIERLERKVEHMDEMLRAVEAATDLETARCRAQKGLNPP